MTRGGVGLSGRCSAARTDIYATQIENSRTGWKGWLPAVRVPAGRDVTRLAAPVSTKIRPEAAAVVRARLGAGIRVELADLTPALAASLRHAASMHYPQFYEKQRVRASIWEIVRRVPWTSPKAQSPRSV